MSARAIGLTFAVGNLGWLFGAVAGPRISARFGVGPILIAGGALTGAPLLLVPLAPRSFPIPLLVLQQLIVGFGIVLYNVNAISLMQAFTPDRLLGRMNASRRFVVWGTIPFGSVMGGALAHQIGLRPLMFAGAAGASVGFLFMLFSPLREIRRLPTEPVVEQELMALPALAVPDA